jgi:hypothetical protein
MDHPLIGRPVLDEMGFVANQLLDSVRDRFYLHDFSHVGEELLEMNKQPSGALSKVLLKPADIPELIEDLPDVIPLANGKKATRRKQLRSSVHNEGYFGRQQSEEYDGDHDVVQPNIKFAILKE